MPFLQVQDGISAWSACLNGAVTGMLSCVHSSRACLCACYYGVHLAWLLCSQTSHASTKLALLLLLGSASAHSLPSMPDACACACACAGGFHAGWPCASVRALLPSVQEDLHAGQCRRLSGGHCACCGGECWAVAQLPGAAGHASLHGCDRHRARLHALHRQCHRTACPGALHGDMLTLMLQLLLPLWIYCCTGHHCSHASGQCVSDGSPHSHPHLLTATHAVTKPRHIWHLSGLVVVVAIK